jgi:peptidoglycan/xylan/chitin deacetylase (PgdA/CDA1 family)
LKKRIIISAFSWMLWRTGIADFARRAYANKGRFVLEFHGVASRRYPNIPLQVQPRLIISELKEIINRLKKNFSFLTPDEFFLSNKSGLLLTFDDGFANNYTNVFPVLKELETPAIFFVSTQHIINPKDWLPSVKSFVMKHWKRMEEIPKCIAADLFDGMTEQQLAKVAKNPLITIGGHTITHPFLTKCRNEELTYEIKESKKMLEELSCNVVKYFAYPTGDYDFKVIDAVRAAGYMAAFAENSRQIGNSLFEIPRVGIYSSGQDYLAAKLSGLYRKPIKTKFFE